MDGVENKFSIHSICRICLQQLKTENSFDLFCVPGLVKKFCICTSLSVEPQDGYPKNICGVCHTRLNDLHDFQKQCVDSVQKFQEMVAANTFSVDLMMEGVDAGDDPNMLHDDDDGEQHNFDPLLDQKMELIDNDEDVFKLLEKEKKEKEEEDTNPFDEKNFYSSDSSSSESENFDEAFGGAAASSDSDDDDIPLSMRMGTRSQKSSSSTVPKPEKPKRKRIPAAEKHLHRIIDCHVCHQKFKKTKNYQDHMKYHNDKLPHQCTVETCRKGFTTLNSLRLHIEHTHAETLEIFTCPQAGCERTFTRKGLLTWHLKKIHNTKVESEPRSFPCTECEKIFRCPMALKKHMYKHDGKELPFVCNICGKRFVTNSVLKDHLVRHAGIKNYVCPYCGVGKTTRQELTKHTNTHTQEKQFKCEQCPYASHNKQDLQRHVKVVHDKIKEFACQFCGKAFGKSNACKMHEMTHTGEKRCECKVCGKQFLYAKGLTRHLQTHEKRVQRSIDTYRERNADGDSAVMTEPPLPVNSSKDAYAKATEDLLKVCAESLATVPRDQRRVERVDITQLAGTVINPIPSVLVPSWSSSSSQPNQSMVKESQQHICPDCGQGFNWIGNLKSHQRIVHEGVKDFACRFCERRFAKARTLKDHEMIHTGEKPHECTQCTMRFIKIDALKRHMKVHLKHPPICPTRVHAACEELQVLVRHERVSKREAEEKRQAIAEAAREQLIEMKKQQDELKELS